MVKIVEENHSIGYWKGKSGTERSFIQLANFGLKLIRHVRAPPQLPQYTLVLWFRSLNVNVQEDLTVLLLGKFLCCFNTMHIYKFKFPAGKPLYHGTK